MKIAIMQPYFLPYIGYWQLLHAVDQFVVYDNIKYTKKGWINRNRYLLENKDKYFTIPLQKDSDYLNICERQISNSYNKNKLFRQISSAYKKAPYYAPIIDIFHTILFYNETNLFDYIFHSIKIICSILDIKTNIIISSSLPCNQTLKSPQRIFDICNYLKANTYINPIGGTKLYSKEEFATHDINLLFHQSLPITYQQTATSFIPYLSILDILMFNNINEVKNFLEKATYN